MFSSPAAKAGRVSARRGQLVASAFTTLSTPPTRVAVTTGL